MILIPVKNLAHAKQRLSPVLTPEERVELARAMCEDVLGTVARWHQRPPVAVVTSDPWAAGLAQRFGFEVICDDANPGETGAIELATKACLDRGASSALVIPADIPLIAVDELQRIMNAAPPAGSVLVPDAAGRGTNAAFRSPADLFPLRFGNDSFLPHRASARASGLPCVVLELPGIALDLDRPDDLDRLIAASGDRKSQKLVRGWNLSAREKVYGSAEG
jgi:2-phospho-L-lactate/phosphoenolpyruvate guanylyltransferase